MIKINLPCSTRIVIYSSNTFTLTFLFCISLLYFKFYLFFYRENTHWWASLSPDLSVEMTIFFSGSFYLSNLLTSNNNLFHILYMNNVKIMKHIACNVWHIYHSPQLCLLQAPNESNLVDFFPLSLFFPSV